jgi:hypothetical protein
MILDSDRLKAFEPKARAKTAGASDDPRVIEAAQDAGIAMKMMRKARKLRLGVLAEQIGMRAEDLRRAEAGQLVERSEDGRLIDCPGALLVLVARLTDHKFIPLP